MMRLLFILFPFTCFAQDITKPTIKLTDVVEDSPGIFTLGFTTTDKYGTVRLDIIKADSVVASDKSTTPYYINVDTHGWGNGAYTLTAKTYDAAGNWKTTPVNIVVRNYETIKADSIRILNGSCFTTTPCKYYVRKPKDATQREFEYFDEQMNRINLIQFYIYGIWSYVGGGVDDVVAELVGEAGGELGEVFVAGHDPPPSPPRMSVLR